MSDCNIQEIEKELGSLSPHRIFQDWLKEAKLRAYEHEVNEATAMTLSTVTPDGQPHSRVVLLKGTSEKGPIFYTNYSSKKGEDLKHNQKLALNFYWPQNFRQIKICGTASKLSRSESVAYWESRPKGSQISQKLSDQSKPIDSRETLEQRHRDLEDEFKDSEVVPCPEDWGGYQVTVDSFEFWIGRKNRLHDRFFFQRQGTQWSVSRLQP